MTDFEYKLVAAINQKAEELAEAAIDELADRCEAFWDVQDKWSTVQRQNLLNDVADAIAKKWLGVK